MDKAPEVRGSDGHASSLNKLGMRRFSMSWRGEERRLHMLRQAQHEVKC